MMLQNNRENPQKDLYSKKIKMGPAGFEPATKELYCRMSYCEKISRFIMNLEIFTSAWRF